MPPAPALGPLARLLDLDATFLPVAQMRQITRVTALDGSRITGEVDLGAEHWVYPQHFPADPIFPGTLMIEAAAQLVALWAWAQGHRGRPRLLRTSASFHHPVTTSTARLDLRAEVQGKRHLQFGNVELFADTTHVATVEAVLAVLASV
jgi:3-hydroxymyristoyl/3-hydroxydecanoyl-(acyl carrier protein) dehydratase